MTSYRIEFEPIGRRGQCPTNQSLLVCARQLGVGIISLCGGQGNCHSCKVQVLSGTVSEPTSNELDIFSSQELKAGWRLACQTYPHSDCKLGVPSESMTTPQRTQVEGLEVTVHPEPPVQAYPLQLPTPSLLAPQADADRLLKVLNQRHQLHCGKVDIDVLRALPHQLRSWNWQWVMNPQISYGEDIISRITDVTNSLANGRQLQRLVAEAFSQLALDLCQEIEANVEEIVEAVVVGNTAMHHLFLGLPVRQLAYSPFVPTVSESLDIKARDLGLRIAPGAYVHMLPNIAGFVGADHVAMLLATGVWQAEGLIVALDIGTNTEVSLVNNGEITTVSCASGPAFEGGHIKDGMRAARGAIERLRIANDSIQYQTIDDAPPIGICGSGILDAMAQLYLAGTINKGGRMKDGHPRLRTRKKQREFVLVSEEEREGHPAIVITQHDVRELQLAKAAIRTGIQVLLETNGCSEEEISQVIIAGAFGTYIDVSSAITIGMLPSMPLDRFQQVGNAAGMGARLALVSLSKRAETHTIASRVRYIELASSPNFMQTFIQAGYLGRYRMTHSKREEID